MNKNPRNCTQPEASENGSARVQRREKSKYNSFKIQQLMVSYLG